MIVNRGFKPKREKNDRLPQGQYETSDFPVLSLGPTPIVRTQDWRLRVFGLVSQELSWNWSDFLALPMIDIHEDIHCVTKWSKFDTSWRGVDIKHIMSLAGVSDQTSHVVFHSYDGYATNVPLQAVSEHQAIVATSYEDADIPKEHGGPSRIVIPHLYFWKSAKWVNAIEFLDHDEPGFWEVRGYHNEGDPWKEERYSDF